MPKTTQQIIKEEIYIIQEWNHWGIIELFYFLDLEKAKKCFKKLVLEEKKKCRADKSLAKNEDLDGKINGEIKVANDEFKDGYLIEATIYAWYKSSYEYDEWDIQGKTYKLVVKKIS